MRATLDAESAFLNDLAYRISGVETNPQREIVSATDSSMAYGKGHVLGALLDLSIRHLEQDVAVTLGTRNETNFVIEPIPAPTAEQLAIREAWLKQ